MLLAVFLFLVINCACGHVYAENLTTPHVITTVFKETTAELSGIPKEFVSFRSPYLIGTNEGMVALSKAYSTADPSTETSYIAAMLIKTGNQLNKGAVEKEKINILDTGVPFTNFAAAVKNDKTMLNLQKSDPSSHVDKYCCSCQAPYELSYELLNGKDGEKELRLNMVEQPAFFYRREPGNEVDSCFLENEETPILANKDSFVFPATYKKWSQTFLTVAYFSDKDDGFLLMKSNLSSDCYDPSVLKWENDTLLMITSCDNGQRKVYTSTNSGETWAEALASLSRVWGIAPNKTGPSAQGSFITANVSGKNVILFAQPVRRGGRPSGKLLLWMTDGTHIYNVGQISDINKNITAASLLYKDEKLYYLYEVYKEEQKHEIMLGELDEELKRIKYAVRIWNGLEKNFSRYCNPYGQREHCVENEKNELGVPTKGLVGFLSNQSNSTYWKEEYLCVGATVEKGEKIPYGVRFKGPGAGAQWPVGKQGQDQRYHFANYGFTLAATLAIHEKPSAETPLLGASLGGGNAEDLLGLWLTPDGKWKIKKKDKDGKTLLLQNEWELHHTYHVALTMQDGVKKLYVDGIEIWKDEESSTILNPSEQSEKNVSHFYIGGDKEKKSNTGSGAHVSVADVFLYNYALTLPDVLALNVSKILIPRLSGVDILTSLPRKSSKGAYRKNRQKREHPPQPASITTTITTNGGEQHPEQSASGDYTDDHYVNYGISKYAEGVHKRREVQITKEMLKKLSFDHFTCDDNGHCTHNDGTHASAHLRVSIFLLPGVLGFLTGFSFYIFLL